MASVIEFRSKSAYEKWLQRMGDSVRVLSMSTSKRWSLATGFLGDTKTYVVTYEPVLTQYGNNAEPHETGVVVAAKPVPILAEPDQTKFSVHFVKDGTPIEVFDQSGEYYKVVSNSVLGWLHSRNVRVTGRTAPTDKICPRCAETVKAAASVCRFCGHEFSPAPTV
jgi:hypothetical protein